MHLQLETIVSIAEPLRNRQHIHIHSPLPGRENEWEKGREEGKKEEGGRMRGGDVKGKCVTEED